MRLLLVRHGLTGWNEAGRVQGHTDVPLSEAGRGQVARWRLPIGLATAGCITSPLARARETAALLGFVDPPTDRRLCEMAWGAYEGWSLDGLRRHHGAVFAEQEALGLDFRAPGGESPREVAARLRSFLSDVALDRRDLVVIAHKGVLRASIVLAFGWNMLGKPPVAIEDDRALEHELDSTGRLTFTRTVDLRGGA